jgi:hypothetical protein
MIEITPDSTEWSSEDRAVFRAFLNTATGQKFLPKLLEEVPQLLRGGPTNEILIRSGEVAAWGSAAKSILALTLPPPPVPDQATHSRSYPDPLDDDQWADGRKTT